MCTPFTHVTFTQNKTLYHNQPNTDCLCLQGGDDASEKHNMNASKLNKTSANHYSVRIKQISFLCFAVIVYIFNLIPSVFPFEF